MMANVEAAGRRFVAQLQLVTADLLARHKRHCERPSAAGSNQRDVPATRESWQIHATDQVLASYFGENLWRGNPLTVK
jgi:hypothetical protein